MTQLESRPVALPGFGLPLDTLPSWSVEHNKDRFPHAIADFFASEGITVRERRMLDFVTRITDKPEWDRKVFDEAIVAKWKTEACKFDETCQDVYLSEAMFSYCIAELRDKARTHQEKGLVAVMDAEATVVKSDVAVPDSLRQSLMRAIRPLEEVPEHHKDWHPGSDQMVLDLVHPSLFPVVLGRSRALPSGRVPLEDWPDTNVSWGNPSTLQPWGNFQWLPSQIDFTPEGRPKIASYINNLHPQTNPDLYNTLEQLVDKSIPLWNECLSWFHTRIRIGQVGGNDDDWVIPDGVKWVRPTLDDNADDHHGGDDDRAEESENEENDRDWAAVNGFWHEYNQWWERHRILQQPEPSEFRPFSETVNAKGARPINLKAEFKNSGLQVIFKLANIHLTPDKPEYSSSNWHVEGALNEHICATAIYYYDSDNIEPSHLAFRQSVDAEEMVMKPEQYQWSSTCAYYGIENEEPAIQHLGKVTTPQGRLLAFPNVMQHQVQPFRLADPTKPGHRKILAMFLVDPHIPILSTANVPPQRKDWWAQEVRKVEPFASLPEELFQNIIELVDGFPISWQDALEIREKLMEERGRMTDEVNEAMEEDTFYFCEH
ncbi:hypothetical protein MPH_13098 [Macrophomina phaseolina MS6]|uniref:Duf1665 domain containing protein n=1 Tax=Macrophomina phaseolina (strain MS6) TaxID=1126212 RepID=K2QJ43_MACPH|nr:hypothetical protein MPH_13098 [Macrophomina phaseolina MS6]